jgi:RelA/SpoT family protein
MDPAMQYAVPQYTRPEVDAAGAALVNGIPPDEMDHALTVVNNWRSAHSFPLNTFQVGLKANSARVDNTAVAAQRIKRLSSIQLKLRRFKWLPLSQIQDIGGCRAVVASVAKVDELVAAYKDSAIKHKLVDQDDYIREPKKTGYRGVHLIYGYYSDRKDTYNGLKIEMQLRSPLQHAWATAVETVGTFIQQALKSSRGEKEWLRFFALMGSALAFREKTPLVPKTPTKRSDLVEELRAYAAKLDVETRLEAYGRALRILESPNIEKAHYYLLALDPEAKSVTVRGYISNQLERASSDYLQTELAIADRPGSEAVLVSVESLQSLRRAYPNFFLDTRVFLDAVRLALRRN